MKRKPKRIRGNKHQFYVIELTGIDMWLGGYSSILRGPYGSLQESRRVQQKLGDRATVMKRILKDNV